MSIVAAAAALAAAIAALLLYSRASRELRSLAARVASIERSVAEVRGVIGRALEVLEDIEEARLLKRRRRRRYVAALILYEGRLPVDPRLAQRAVEEAVARLGGELLLADARPLVVYYDPVRGALIVRTNHLAVDAVIAALLLVRKVGGARVRIVPLRTAGTLSSAKRALGILERIPTRAG